MPILSINAVALAFGIRPSELISPSRKRLCADARKALAILLRNAGYSWSVVGGVMERSRSTAINAYAAGLALRDRCKHFRRQLEAAITRQNTPTT